MEESEEISTTTPSIATALETFITSIDGLADAFSPTISAITSSRVKLFEETLNSISSIMLEYAESKDVNAREIMKKRIIEQNLSKDKFEIGNVLEGMPELLSEILSKPDWMKSSTQRLPSILSYWVRIREDLKKIELAEKVIQQSFVISLISQHDAFLGKLIQALFLIRPETLNATEKNISLSQLQTFKTIADAKDFIIGKETENVMRKSHGDQIEWLEKQYNIELKKHLPWQRFIEITERRNLFVHSDGLVSNQYLDICKKNGVVFDKDIKIGEVLGVSLDYFKQAYECVLEVGIKLAHLLWRKIYPKSLEEADNNLTGICLDLLVEEKYNLACTISDFATETLKRHSDDRSERILIVNGAQAYKWSGNNEKAKAIINSIDWSASSDDFKLAKAVIQEEYEEANSLVKKIGTNGDISIYNYREWPLFKEYRKTQGFLKTFEEVFNEPFYSQSDIFLAIDWLKDLSELKLISEKEKSIIKTTINGERIKSLEESISPSTEIVNAQVETNPSEAAQ